MAIQSIFAIFPPSQIAPKFWNTNSPYLSEIVSVNWRSLLGETDSFDIVKYNSLKIQYFYIFCSNNIKEKIKPNVME